MTTDDPTFFLSSAGESRRLAEPRACWAIRRMKDSMRDDYMLVAIEPPLQQESGIGFIDLYKLIIATRFKNRSLYPIVSWPCHIFVFRPLREDVTNGTQFDSGNVRLTAWAMLFKTAAEANLHFRRLS